MPRCFTPPPSASSSAKRRARARTTSRLSFLRARPTRSFSPVSKASTSTRHSSTFFPQPPRRFQTSSRQGQTRNSSVRARSQARRISQDTRLMNDDGHEHTTRHCASMN
ncbi:hypothetical protein BDV97DRAFT_387672 [Delphinella strobiligena]|nr:hypothetical protein BDV97DRAFT_387672 [Delphinella strobiligena]